MSEGDYIRAMVALDMTHVMYLERLHEVSGQDGSVFDSDLPSRWLAVCLLCHEAFFHRVQTYLLVSPRQCAFVSLLAAFLSVLAACAEYSAYCFLQQAFGWKFARRDTAVRNIKIYVMPVEA